MGTGAALRGSLHCVQGKQGKQAAPLRPKIAGTRHPRKNSQQQLYFSVNSGGASIRQCAMNRPTGSYAEGRRMRHPPGPRLKPSFEAGFFRWTESPAPPAEAGGSLRENSPNSSACAG